MGREALLTLVPNRILAGHGCSETYLIAAE
jgi:hypothetical protein